ncbi:hypothetical protein BH18ACT16_BH18ACT16_12590 [soil metagenome]
MLLDFAPSPVSLLWNSGRLKVSSEDVAASKQSGVA